MLSCLVLLSSVLNKIVGLSLTFIFYCLNALSVVLKFGSVMRLYLDSYILTLLCYVCPLLVVLICFDCMSGLINSGLRLFHCFWLNFCASLSLYFWISFHLYTFSLVSLHDKGYMSLLKLIYSLSCCHELSHAQSQLPCLCFVRHCCDMRIAITLQLNTFMQA